MFFLIIFLFYDFSNMGCWTCIVYDDYDSSNKTQPLVMWNVYSNKWGLWIDFWAVGHLTRLQINGAGYVKIKENTDYMKQSSVWGAVNMVN